MMSFSILGIESSFTLNIIMTGLSNSFSYKPKKQTGWNYFQKQTHSKRDNTPISYFYFESVQKILLVLDVLFVIHIVL